MNDLILCTSCTRHVRRTEDQCPFCGTAVPDAAKAVVPRTAPRGLSRAKLYAFHAAMATGVAASGCGGATAGNADAATPADARAEGQVVVDAGGDTASGEASTGEAGQDATTDGTTTAEAGQDAVADTMPDHGPPPPPYGCVFPEGCGDVKV